MQRQCKTSSRQARAGKQRPKPLTKSKAAHPSFILQAGAQSNNLPLSASVPINPPASPFLTRSPPGAGCPGMHTG
jgi:hypothetical protein